MQALDIHGARSRNRTGTPLRAGDFKSAIFSFKNKQITNFPQHNKGEILSLQPFKLKGSKIVAVRNLRRPAPSPASCRPNTKPKNSG